MSSPSSTKIRFASKIADRIRDLKSKESYDHLTDPRSEREMTYLLGGIRLYDCGKKRWVWRPG